MLSVYDFEPNPSNSSDVDTQAELKASGIPFQLTQGTGPFSRVKGLNALIAAAEKTDVLFIVWQIRSRPMFP